MKTPAEPRRHLELLNVKVPADLAAEVRRAAREDDRTVSAFLRRILVAAVKPSKDATP